MDEACSVVLGRELNRQSCALTGLQRHPFVAYAASGLSGCLKGPTYQRERGIRARGLAENPPMGRFVGAPIGFLVDRYGKRLPFNGSSSSLTAS